MGGRYLRWMKRGAMLGMVVAVFLVVAPVTSGYQYRPGGAYLDYGKRPSLMNGFAAPFATYEIDPNGGGIIEVWADGQRYTAAVTDAVYGLWHFTHYVRTGSRASLRQAKRAAVWLKRKQDPRTGIYPVTYSFDLGPRDDGTGDLYLQAPWFGANNQALPISLLSRLYRATENEKYLRQAELALRPLAKPYGAGGVQAPFFDTGHVFFEGYATLPVPVHTLSHLVQTLIGLYDMRDLSPLAARLFKTGIATLPIALPYYDLPDQGRTAAWLAHLTDPPRQVSTLRGFYQEFMVAELRALDSISPNPVIRQHQLAWRTQLPAICANPAEGCAFH